MPRRVFQLGMPSKPPANPERLDELGCFHEGDRIIVAKGEFAGRRGRVALTHNSNHQLVARLLALSPGLVRVVLDRDENEGGWSGVLPVELLRPTRPESDEELRARLQEARRMLGQALELGGAALDQAADSLNLNRREMPISETGEAPEGLKKQ